MKIVNIDASPKHCEEIFEFQHFILEVVSSLNREIVHKNYIQVCYPNPGQTQAALPLGPIRKFDEDGYENIAYLLHTIPVYLRKTRPERRDEEDVVDPLGAYYPNRPNDNPYVELYVDNIAASAYGNGTSNAEHFKWLFTKVLIHELAHSALDIFNNENWRQGIEKVLYSTEFGRWREESMANAVTLKIIKNFGDTGFYEYAKRYMLRRQPQEYALGVRMEDLDFWDFRSVIDGKRDGVCSELQDAWLDYAKGNPVWSELTRWNEILSSSIVYSYNERYYTDHQDLVLDIVKDYIARSGSISFEDLCSVFPNVKVQSKEAYRPIAAAQNDSQFFTETNQVLHLSDGDYALYKYWYNDELDAFIRRANNNQFNVKIIKNY